MPARILIVEDDADHARMVQLTLETHGYHTTLVRNGREALEHVGQTAPDLIVLDVKMPEMDGWQTLQQLRADHATSALPVIVLTAKTEADDIAMSWHVGADLYLKKPFNAPTLLSFVERLLAQMRKTRH